MNDTDLIDELRDGMRAWTDDAEVPDGFAAHARRTARRRSARRAATAGTPLLAAAGIATVVATGVGSRSSARHDTQTPNGGAQVHDTSYIVGRVKASLAADAQNGTVIHSDDYRTGDLSSDGTPVNLGWKMDDGYEYVSADGTQYATDTQYWPNGSVQLSSFDSYVPGANGHGTQTETVINPASRKYSVKRYPGTPDPNGGAPLDLFSTPSQVQQALQGGQVTQEGAATIDGTQAIALSLTVPSNPPQTTVLFVDAQSYQPLRMVWQVKGGGHVLFVQDWIPTTAPNIASAKDGSIPAGYTRASPAEVY